MVGWKIRVRYVVSCKSWYARYPQLTALDCTHIYIWSHRLIIIPLPPLFQISRVEHKLMERMRKTEGKRRKKKKLKWRPFLPSNKDRPKMVHSLIRTCMTKRARSSISSGTPIQGSYPTEMYTSSANTSASVLATRQGISLERGVSCMVNHLVGREDEGKTPTMVDSLVWMFERRGGGSTRIGWPDICILTNSNNNNNSRKYWGTDGPNGEQNRRSPQRTETSRGASPRPIRKLALDA